MGITASNYPLKQHPGYDLHTDTEKGRCATADPRSPDRPNTVQENLVGLTQEPAVVTSLLFPVCRSSANSG
ncbi:hypothetical protein RHOER0001_4870 [Rhodococcus erythropolis SK121]|nr:hypothetical protein RHOER0001_4870 [Rhodococcus erythropolis SK121]